MKKYFQFSNGINYKWNIFIKYFQIQFFFVQITGSPIHKSTGRSTPPMRSRSGTVTPTSTTALGINQQTVHVKGVDNKLVQLIMDEIVEGGAKVKWSDIAGQEVNRRMTKTNK